MTYSSAKASFEAVVKSMQADLQRYVDSGKATQRAVDVRTQIINSLVEFYDAADSEVNQLLSEKDNISVRYNKLHGDAGKLVTFTELHGINPNLIFYYSHNELLQMLNSGIKITPPRFDFNDITLSETEYAGFPKINLPEEKETETAYGHDEKYQRLNLLCKKRQ